MFRLVGTLRRNAYIVSLPVRQPCEVYSKLGQMEPGYLLIKMLRQPVDPCLVAFGPEFYLSQRLVAE